MTDYSTQKKYGRIAGLLYLIIIGCGIFSEGVVRSGLIIPDDPQTTIANITNSELLFRVGFISDLIMVISDISIALVFYLMLMSVNKSVSMLAGLFRLVQAIIIGINLMNHFSIILVLNNTGLNDSFNTEQISSLVMFLIEAHSYGYLLSGVFFGLSCILLSYLIKKSLFLPSVFGIMIGVAGVFYLTDSFTQFLFPEFSTITEIMVIAGALIAEVSFAVWLTVKGAVQFQK